MSGVPFISVRQLLANRLTPLGRLMAASHRLRAADNALGEVLGDPLKSHVSVAAVSGETVTLVATSPAWSSRVRYLTPQILDHLRERLENPQLARVQIVTRPTESSVAPPPRPRPRLSRRSAALIESVARASSDSPALASALMRLAGKASGRERD